MSDQRVSRSATKQRNDAAGTASRTPQRLLGTETVSAIHGLPQSPANSNEKKNNQLHAMLRSATKQRNDAAGTASRTPDRSVSSETVSAINGFLRSPANPTARKENPTQVMLRSTSEHSPSAVSAERPAFFRLDEEDAGSTNSASSFARQPALPTPRSIIRAFTATASDKVMDIVQKSTRRNPSETPAAEKMGLREWVKKEFESRDLEHLLREEDMSKEQTAQAMYNYIAGLSQLTDEQINIAKQLNDLKKNYSGKKGTATDFMKAFGVHLPLNSVNFQYASKDDLDGLKCCLFVDALHVIDTKRRLFTEEDDNSGSHNTLPKFGDKNASSAAQTDVDTSDMETEETTGRGILQADASDTSMQASQLSSILSEVTQSPPKMHVGIVRRQGAPGSVTRSLPRDKKSDVDPSASLYMSGSGLEESTADAFELQQTRISDVVPVSPERTPRAGAPPYDLSQVDSPRSPTSPVRVVEPSTSDPSQPASNAPQQPHQPVARRLNHEVAVLQTRILELKDTEMRLKESIAWLDAENRNMRTLHGQPLESQECEHLANVIRTQQRDLDSMQQNMERLGEAFRNQAAQNEQMESANQSLQAQLRDASRFMPEDTPQSRELINNIKLSMRGYKDSIIDSVPKDKQKEATHGMVASLYNRTHQEAINVFLEAFKDQQDHLSVVAKHAFAVMKNAPVHISDAIGWQTKLSMLVFMDKTLSLLEQITQLRNELQGHEKRFRIDEGSEDEAADDDESVHASASMLPDTLRRPLFEDVNEHDAARVLRLVADRVYKKPRGPFLRQRDVKRLFSRRSVAGRPGRQSGRPLLKQPVSQRQTSQRASSPVHRPLRAPSRTCTIKSVELTPYTKAPWDNPLSLSFDRSSTTRHQVEMKKRIWINEKLSGSLRRRVLTLRSGRQKIELGSLHNRAAIGSVIPIFLRLGLNSDNQVVYACLHVVAASEKPFQLSNGNDAWKKFAIGARRPSASARGMVVWGGDQAPKATFENIKFRRCKPRLLNAPEPGESADLLRRVYVCPPGFDEAKPLAGDLPVTAVVVFITDKRMQELISHRETPEWARTYLTNGNFPYLKDADVLRQNGAGSGSDLRLLFGVEPRWADAANTGYFAVVARSAASVQVDCALSWTPWDCVSRLKHVGEVCGVVSVCCSVLEHSG